MNDITEQIRARAAKVGIGINDLHKRAGVSGNTLWRWGKMVEKPRQGIIDKFNEALTKLENDIGIEWGPEISADSIKLDSLNNDDQVYVEWIDGSKGVWAVETAGFLCAGDNLCRVKFVRLPVGPPSHNRQV